MTRRGFFSTLAAVVGAGVVAKAAPQSVYQPIELVGPPIKVPESFYVMTWDAEKWKQHARYYGMSEARISATRLVELK